VPPNNKPPDSAKNHTTVVSEPQRTACAIHKSGDEVHLIRVKGRPKAVVLRASWVLGEFEYDVRLGPHLITGVTHDQISALLKTRAPRRPSSFAALPPVKASLRKHQGS
jgi:hypothetical protein